MVFNVLWKFSFLWLLSFVSLGVLAVATFLASTSESADYSPQSLGNLYLVDPETITFRALSPYEVKAKIYNDAAISFLRKGYNPKETFILLDGSGSMLESLPDAVSATKSVVESLRDIDYLSLSIVFLGVRKSESNIELNEKCKRIDTSQSMIDACLETFSKKRVGGRSPTGPALEMVSKICREDHDTLVILISDGGPSEPGKCKQEAYYRALEFGEVVKRKARLVTIGVEGESYDSYLTAVTGKEVIAKLSSSFENEIENTTKPGASFTFRFLKSRHTGLKASIFVDEYADIERIMDHATTTEPRNDRHRRYSGKVANPIVLSTNLQCKRGSVFSMKQTNGNFEANLGQCSLKTIYDSGGEKGSGVAPGTSIGYVGRTEAFEKSDFFEPDHLQTTKLININRSSKEETIDFDISVLNLNPHSFSPRKVPSYIHFFVPQEPGVVINAGQSVFEFPITSWLHFQPDGWSDAVAISPEAAKDLCDATNPFVVYILGNSRTSKSSYCNTCVSAFAKFVFSPQKTCPKDREACTMRIHVIDFLELFPELGCMKLKIVDMYGAPEYLKEYFSALFASEYDVKMHERFEYMRALNDNSKMKELLEVQVDDDTLPEASVFMYFIDYEDFTYEHGLEDSAMDKHHDFFVSLTNIMDELNIKIPYRIGIKCFVNQSEADLNELGYCSKVKFDRAVNQIMSWQIARLKREQIFPLHPYIAEYDQPKDIVKETKAVVQCLDLFWEWKALPTTKTNTKRTDILKEHYQKKMKTLAEENHETVENHEFCPDEVDEEGTDYSVMGFLKGLFGTSTEDIENA